MNSPSSLTQRENALACLLRSFLLLRAFPIGDYFSLNATLWRVHLVHHEAEMIGAGALQLPATDAELERAFFALAPTLETDFGISLTSQKQNHPPFIHIWTAYFLPDEAHKQFRVLAEAFEDGDTAPATVFALWFALNLPLSNDAPQFEPLEPGEMDLLDRFFQALRRGEDVSPILKPTYPPIEALV